MRIGPKLQLHTEWGNSLITLKSHVKGAASVTYTSPLSSDGKTTISQKPKQILYILRSGTNIFVQTSDGTKITHGVGKRAHKFKEIHIYEKGHRCIKQGNEVVDNQEIGGSALLRVILRNNDIRIFPAKGLEGNFDVKKHERGK